MRSGGPVPREGRPMGFDPPEHNAARCFMGTRIVMGAVQVLFQARPDVPPKTNVRSSAFDRERKAQKLDVSAKSKIGGGSVLTLEGEPSFRQEVTGLIKNLSTLGHARAQVAEIICVSEPGRKTTLPRERNVVYVVEPDVERSRRVRISLVNSHHSIRIIAPAHNTLDELEQTPLSDVFAMVAHHVLEDDVVEGIAHVIERDDETLFCNHRRHQVGEQIPGAAMRTKPVAHREEYALPEWPQRPVQRGGDDPVEHVADRESPVASA